ncbi:transposase domain-containing protein [Virgibacillus halodenitrificans]|uniref:transposase domain-containing protein n=1 Tax=Virgibacillus halodenitrificans TaxID=1482 RepID=UPI00350E935F
MGTAKEKGVNPFHYPEYLLEELPNMNNTKIEDLNQFLPRSPTLPEECRIPNKTK